MEEPPSSPGLINLETPVASTFHPAPPPGSSSPSHTARPRATSLLDDDEEGIGPEASLVGLPEPVEPAFLPARHGLYAGQHGINAELTGPAEDVEAPDVALDDSVSELYIPGLSSHTLFTVLPTTDGLTHLVEKYLSPTQRPRRDLSGEWQGRTLDELIQARSWRAVARFAQDTILAGSPDQTSFLLQHWILRLHALMRLNLVDHFGAELSSVFSILPPSSYLGNPSAFVDPAVLPFHPVVPFELHVMLACLPGLRGEKERSAEVLSDVLRASKVMMWTLSRQGDSEGAALWRQRAERVAALVAGVLLELKAESSLSNMLKSTGSPTLVASLCRLQYSAGDLFALHDTAALYPQTDLRVSRRVKALERIGRGDWAVAEQEWRALVSEDPTDMEALNNLAVVLLFSEKLQEAIDLLNLILKDHPDIGYSSPTTLFNFATLMELRTDGALAAKMGLLQNVAAKGGEDLKPSMLKLAA